jgi:hypothetical protein
MAKMDNKKHLTVIRDNVKNTCPFGLPIPTGCKTVGDLVEKMQPSTSEEIYTQNMNLLKNILEEKPCIYNKLVIKDKCLCVAPEEHTINMPIGSPLYYKPMSGTLMTGLMTFPLGYYNDNSLDRNTYNSFYSIESISKNLVSLIEKYSTVIEYREAIYKLNALNA